MHSRCTHDYRESFVINKKYHTVRTVPKSNGNIVEIEAKSTPLTPVHDHSLSWIGSDTSIKSGGAKLEL